MNRLNNYPINGYFIKYPLQITREMRRSAKSAGLPCASAMEIGKYMTVDVLRNGFQIPPTAVVFETHAEALRAAEVHNKFGGYTLEEVDEMIAISMDLTLQHHEG